MDLGLKDKVAIVVGASRGLGKAIASRLADEGCNLAICARGEGPLLETAAELEGKGIDVLAAALDVTEPETADSFVAQTVEKFGRLDILVNNVGGNRRKPFAETTDADWDEILDLNFGSHVRFSRAAIPELKKRGGAILFVSSVFGREIGGPGLSIYNTTKSALISLSKIMAQELGPDGIRVNSIAPGSIRFPGGSWDRRCKEDPEGMAKFAEENFALRRFGTAEEIGDVAAYLVSERASLITGACINVDGGQSRSLI
jgi:3-oxoacyl-[acyl-carrier protein] reductase